MQKAFVSSLPSLKPWGIALGLIGHSQGLRNNALGKGNIILQPDGYGACFSTTADSVVKHQQQKKKKKMGLSTSVIYVNEEKVSVEKARIKMLKGSQLNLLKKSSQVCKAADGVSQHLSDSTIISQKDPTNPREIQFDSTVIQAESLGADDLGKDFTHVSSSKCTKKKMTTKPGLKEKNLKNKKQKNISAKYISDMKDQGKSNAFNETLTAFINVCMYLGHDREALKVFNYYTHSNPGIPYKNVTIVSYNEALKQMAVQGNYNEMKSLVKNFKKNSVQPNLHTFAYILSCLDHLHDKTCVVKEVEDILKWMEKEKISLEDIFSSALFPSDSLQYCLKAVQRVIPNVKEQLSAFDTSNKSIEAKTSYHNCLVDSLNGSFFTNKVLSPAEGIFTSDELMKLAEEQIKTELQSYIEIPSIYIEERHSSAKTDVEVELEKLEKQWRSSLHFHLSNVKEVLRDEFLRMRMESSCLNVFPFICALREEQLVELLMMNIKTWIWGNELYSHSLSKLAAELGNQCYQQFYCHYRQNTSALMKRYKKYCLSYLDQTSPECSYVPRVQWEKLLQDSLIKEGKSLMDYPPPWPFTVKFALGKHLLNIIISSVKINNKPVFNKILRYGKKLSREEIALSPILKKMFPSLSVDATKSLIFPAAMLPMVSPPLPWTNLMSGGYVLRKLDFVRFMPFARQQMIQLEEGGVQALYPVFDSLNQMGAVPWKINRTMFDIIKEVFLDKGWMEMDIPMNPAKLKPPAKAYPSMSAEQKLQKKKEMVAFRRKERELLSLWSHMLYKLSIANFFLDKVIWLPLNLDFRGRTYAIHPHLTHYSDDATRSLLCFAQGKKLGPGGLAWLKLHLVNLTGLKKRCNVQERLKYCEEVMDEILDSADNPLHGRLWWTQSDDPWQALAACKELAAALRSGDPENYVSHLPIHQDGSCNGLQHYAALGRDRAGASSVNLSSSPVPQDVYSDVLELVENARKEEVEKGIKIAKDLEGLVQRKIIKQTVMTTVYGVTRYGAREQISRKLKDLNLKDFPVYLAAHYLAEHTFASIGTLFSSAKAIQYWLLNIAEGVCRNQSRNMEWMTPLGFPVVQPYSKFAAYHRLYGKFSPWFDSDYFMVPDVQKQKNAFPPNYIHSLDSCHMMLTSLYSQYEGITFVSIHDCFWTHACTVPIMNKICREQFVSLYSLPILEELAKALTNRFGERSSFCKPLRHVSGEKAHINESLDKLLANVPEKGEFDLKEVLNSVYFFS